AAVAIHTMKRAQAVMNLHEASAEPCNEEEEEPKMKRIALRVDEGGDFAPPAQEESPAVRSILIPYIDDSISERDLFDAFNKTGDVQEVMLFRGVVSRALVVFARKETVITVADRSLITVSGCTYFVDSVTEVPIPSM
ncbi:hypothetical protein PENTCL1PPCAC_3015, partial [Pristionchus entomophagus]